jgi:Flp pilus assembly protein TadD
MPSWSRPRVLLLGAATLAAVAGLTLAAWAVWPRASAQTDPSAAGSVAPTDTAAATPSGTDSSRLAPTPVRSTPAAGSTSAPDLARIVAEAERAYASGDYSAAVMGYNRALAITPGDPGLEARLNEAGKQYRVAREIAEQRAAAFKAFESGDYESALRVFYRLPDAASPMVKDWISAGWYNLGVQALQEGDCGAASSHLREALTLVPQDRDSTDALRLARACAAERGSTAFRLAADRLPVRTIR